MNAIVSAFLVQESSELSAQKDFVFLVSQKFAYQRKRLCSSPAIYARN